MHFTHVYCRVTFSKYIPFFLNLRYQGRGYPHLHLLACLDAKDTPNSTTDFDKFVSARIPDPEKEPELYRLVTTYMYHRKCGRFNTSGKKDSCCKNGKDCRYHFPHKFTPTTRSKINF